MFAPGSMARNPFSKGSAEALGFDSLWSEFSLMMKDDD